MSDLRDLYQEVILDHTKRPRNCKRLESPTGSANGHNPLCGDKLTVYLNVQGDVIQEVSFEGSGCAISTASASMMTESVKGKTRSEANALFERFHKMLTSKESDAVDPLDMGKLGVFAGVREFPVRVKCATLSWHTLRAALENEKDSVSTE
ncbi:MAG: Fe-S cluster assembly sulfur transfer protein SufU [Acidobacteriota bacterium]